VVLLVPSGIWSQATSPTIPPTRVPETPEPELSPKNRSVDQPRSASPEEFNPLPNPAITPVPWQANDPPTPAISIHVSAPAGASAGADVEYKILVENRSQGEAHHVRVTAAKPDGVQLFSVDPATPDEESTRSLAWRLGTMKPGDRRVIRVSARPVKDGLTAIDFVARVYFEHGQKVRTVLHRPQIAVRKITPQFALEEQDITCRLIVENTGVVDLVNVEVRDILDEGLVLIENGQPRGTEYVQKIGTLAPKQAREFTYTIRAQRRGRLKSRLVAGAERGASAQKEWSIDVGPSPLILRMTGPKQVYLNYPAQYDLVVEYAGTTPIDNVTVVFMLQKNVKVVRATPGAQTFGDRLQWAIPRLLPRDRRTFSVWLQSEAAGTIPSFAHVLWSGPKQTAEAVTEFLGAVALHLEVRESNDPIRVGDKVRYTLTITNRGTKPATDVKLFCRYPVTQFTLDPDGSDGKSLIDPQTQAPIQEIGPLTIAPRATLSKIITLKATGAGKAIVHFEMESSELPTGNVTRQEPTTITQ
jgi:uncharacterized repeat protein (TIGR01451 family)